MKRKNFIRTTIGISAALLPGTKILAKGFHCTKKFFITSGPKKPITIYNNWSSYDELSDNISLTEDLAMRELNELIRLKNNGLHVDYYVMDAFWFDKSGGYRTWHKQHWPNGPDKWLDACKANNIKPGMWFSTNLVGLSNGPMLEIIPEWKDSVTSDPNLLCLYSGGYLKHLSGSLQMWYDKGVRAFKFDFAYFNAGVMGAEKIHLASEIEEMNKVAFMDMLKQFRYQNEDVLIIGYNGFGGDMNDSVTPFRKTVDPRWLEVFDTLYCGDPRISDVPAMNIWRSEDIFSDHMVRQFEFNGLPLHRIDNCGFMIGTTGTCYSRAKNAWKGELILSLARGGWVNVYHGNLELLNYNDAKWFAKTQNMFRALQAYGLKSTFGAVPGTRKPYGFKVQGINGTVCTVVNPSQEIVEMDLPVENFSNSKIIYADGGYSPQLSGKKVTLGAEQLVVIGFDEYADAKCNLGIDGTINIPVSIEKINADFKETGMNKIEATIKGVAGKDIRIFMQQFGDDGLAKRSWGGAPPNGKKMNEFLKIEVTQDNKIIPMHIEYDKMIWCGLSWGAAEINHKDFDENKLLTIRCTSTETYKLKLHGEVYATGYK
jgi:hypothetical protein